MERDAGEVETGPAVDTAAAAGSSTPLVLELGELGRAISGIFVEKTGTPTATNKRIATSIRAKAARANVQSLEDLDDSVSGSSLLWRVEFQGPTVSA